VPRRIHGPDLRTLLDMGQAKGDPRRPWTTWRAPPHGLVRLMRRIRKTPTRYRVPGWVRGLLEGERGPWEP
jgi:hypothetical protein